MTKMKIFVKKLDGYWHLEAAGFLLKTPYSDDAPRRDVVGYARKVFPDNPIHEKDQNANGMMKEAVELADHVTVSERFST